jgi:hypothetical protein
VPYSAVTKASTPCQYALISKVFPDPDFPGCVITEFSKLFLYLSFLTEAKPRNLYC